MIPSRSEILAGKFYFNDTSFNSLMPKRIYHVLLISSVYDAFILEDDGRIDEQIFNEYVSLNLRYPPQFLQATTEPEAFEILKGQKIDLVITMLSADKKDTFELAENIKKQYPQIPIVVLTPFSREVSLKIDNNLHPAIDYIFSWLGNADILLAIIKLIEDSMNVEHDVSEVGVQAILLVEDSVRFYSSYLPNIYKIIFKQSKSFMTEGLNEHQKMLRMRGRPKILLATNYEEALHCYNKYKENLLGVISDISYKRNGKKDPKAGIHFCQLIKKEDPYMPLLLQSSDAHMEMEAKKIKVGFINKNSKTLSLELRDFVTEYFAFGDFVFKDPDNQLEVSRAHDLKSLQENILRIPNHSLQYHISRNHLSKWLRARALFPLAKVFQMLSPEDFGDCDEVKRFIFDAIASFRLNKSRGVIAEFNRQIFDEYMTFSRIGEGSLGGKARGLAFLDNLIKRNHLHEIDSRIVVTIPRSVVLGTDVFDEFMEENRLYKTALADDFTDEELLHAFVSSRLPFRVHEDLYTLVSVVRKPIAVRSSSLLEDSHYQPFAGIYSTYMIPFIENDERSMIEMLSNAIKAVYASAYFKDSKAYMRATSNVIDEEKMGIVMQEVIGTAYGNRYYPSISGVARSVNFYPIPPEKAEEGIANIALGLGKYIVDGGLTLRFSPKHPKNILQISNPDMALKETQRQFYALDLSSKNFSPHVDDAANLLKLKIKEAEKDDSLRLIASTYDFSNHIIRDTHNHEGKKLITFAGILKHDAFPLGEVLDRILKVGQREMGKPIEIEFAIELAREKDKQHVFNLLQIRPIVEKNELLDVDLDSFRAEDCLLRCETALGNGIIEGIRDLIYVRPDAFKAAKSREIAADIGKLNESFLTTQSHYILVGPGRWGSSDPWLGIPVKWPQISAARLIVESGLENYRIDPSQGTHFFQNLTSFQVGYFTINPYIGDGSYDVAFLNQHKAVYEDEFLRHVRFENDLKIFINGKKSTGLVLKPGHNKRSSKKMALTKPQIES